MTQDPNPGPTPEAGAAPRPDQPDSGTGPPPPQPPPAQHQTPSGTALLSPEQERQWGMLAHVIVLIALVASGGVLAFVAALVVYLVYKDRGPFVRAHTANALNIQIVAGIGFLISGVLMLVFVGFLTYAIIWVVAVVLHVIGAMKANSGEWWNPPLTPRLVS